MLELWVLVVEKNIVVGLILSVIVVKVQVVFFRVFKCLDIKKLLNFEDKNNFLYFYIQKLIFMF